MAEFLIRVLRLFGVGITDKERWQKWLKKHMTPERIALYKENAQKHVAKWKQGDRPVAHYMSITSGSTIDWATSGSPLPLDELRPYIPKSPLSMIRCWFCGGPNKPKYDRCYYCGAPLRMEEE